MTEVDQQPRPVPTDPINVIEIRRATNGFIISAWFDRPYDYGAVAKGYKTYVVSGDLPSDVADCIKKVLTDHPITLDVPIAPARRVP